MIDKIFTKPVDDWEEYAKAAEWCNTHAARIVEYDGYYKVESLPMPTLDELRENKLNELVSSFNERVSGSVTTTDGYEMQFDTSDSLKMQGAVSLMEATGATEGYLTQANDETVYHVPLETMKSVLVEMLAAYAQCHARKQELRALINSAETAEELDEIIISWPV